MVHLLDGTNHTFLFVNSSFILFLGYGVFTTKALNEGDFVCEYAGELISLKEGEDREISYTDGDGSFIYFLKNKRLW